MTSNNTPFTPFFWYTFTSLASCLFLAGNIAVAASTTFGKQAPSDMAATTLPSSGPEPSTMAAAVAGDVTAAAVTYDFVELLRRRGTEAVLDDRNGTYAPGDATILAACDGGKKKKKSARDKTCSAVVNGLGGLGWITEAEAVDPALLSQAIAKAQTRLGEDATGIPTPLLAMNLKADRRAVKDRLGQYADAVQVLANGWRAAGAHTLLLVNIPSFTLHAVNLDTGGTILESRVIDGNAGGHHTPLFATQVVGIQYHPPWYPTPRLIASGHHYMPPGPDNPLGQLLFVTDNPESIYLHDTNDHRLFASARRDFSSGCIRVQKWRELAMALGHYDSDTLDSKLAGARTYTEKLEQPVPVVVTYSLADAVGAGAGLWPDIYGYAQGKDYSIVPKHPLTVSR